jgi:hypothetical protein
MSEEEFYTRGIREKREEHVVKWLSYVDSKTN